MDYRAWNEAVTLTWAWCLDPGTPQHMHDMPYIPHIHDPRTQATDLGAQATDLGAQATDLGAQATDLGAQATDLRAQTTDPRAVNR